jgi:nucleotide-binding universal stress UspA family protein
MLKNLLVHIPSERSMRPVIDVAVALTARWQAHLDAVTIGYESTNAASLVAEGGAAVAAVMELEHGRALERADAAVSVFEGEARLAEISYAMRALTASPFEVAEMMGTLARLYDLTVVLQPERSASYDNAVPEGVLFESGRPMLMIPYIHKGALEADHVGIAWDGSRLAARAVHDAWPFLSAASSVTLIAVNEDDDAVGEASSAAIAVHLARYGIHARIERLNADRSNVQNTILSASTDAGIGLLVMGGYGHSRLQERILGGVTRGFFEGTTIPTLMSH